MPIACLTLPRSPKCGVSDYSIKLFESLKSSDINVEKICYSSLSTIELLNVLLKYKKVIFQYPARVYSVSFIPLLLLLILRIKKTEVITVLHENSQSHWLRKILNYFICLLSTKLVFTNTYEKQCSSRVFEHKSVVIPIGSNIEPVKKIERREITNRVACFGLIRRGKGIEKFLAFCKENAIDRLFTPILIGVVVDDTLWQELENPLKLYQVEVYLNKPEREVSKLLEMCSFSFSIFPDGASERRGTVLSAFVHSMLICSNSGEQTPINFNQYLIDPSLHNMHSILNYYMDNPLAYQEQSLQINNFARQFSWDHIAHEFVYKVLT